MAASLARWPVGSGISMADITASNIEDTPDWRLLTEFLVTRYASSEGSLRSQIKESMRDLNLQPEQLERICEVIINALYRASRGKQQADNFLAILMRIWLSGANSGEGGWGFFLVEKPGHAAGHSSLESMYVVDLFLYRERSS
jgi:hypothetical protein